MRCAKTREQDCSQRADHGQRVKPVRGKRNYRWQWRRGSPVSIPNTEVKPFSADGTWRVTARKSRSLPVLHKDCGDENFHSPSFSSVAQWQSTRLLTGLLQVRVPPGEPFRVITVRGYHPVLHLMIISMAERNARECRPRIPQASAWSCPAKSQFWAS